MKSVMIIFVSLIFMFDC